MWYILSIGINIFLSQTSLPELGILLASLILLLKTSMYIYIWYNCVGLGCKKIIWNKIIICYADMKNVKFTQNIFFFMNKSCLDINRSFSNIIGLLLLCLFCSFSIFLVELVLHQINRKVTLIKHQWHFFHFGIFSWCFVWLAHQCLVQYLNHIQWYDSRAIIFLSCLLLVCSLPFYLWFLTLNLSAFMFSILCKNRRKEGK